MTAYPAKLTSAIVLAAALTTLRAADCDTTGFETAVQTQQSGITEARDFVIATDSAWAAFWNQVHSLQIPVPERPAVDFSKRVVLVTAMGRRPNGCYNTEITQIEDKSDGRRVICVTDFSPAPEVMVDIEAESAACEAALGRGADAARRLDALLGRLGPDHWRRAELTRRSMGRASGVSP
ncbi:MAG TPA: hypothetical protein PKW75_11535, partial [candidate division Zixibacteria bacterium]|nr:hypothetical protein [candidate division Zixibacteria bacterium]